MFKKLRNRFLLLHMAIVSLLVILFFGSILTISYYAMERSTDSRADMIWGRRRSNTREIFSFEAALEAVPYIAVSPEQGGNISFFRAAPPSAVLGARMTVTPGIYIVTDKEQQLISVESAYDMDGAFYAEITKAALAGSQASGKLRFGDIVLKYRRAAQELLFIDVTGEADFFNGMAYAFLLIALPLLGLVFLLSLFFANRSIKPIEISYNRQKEFIANASHELKTPLAAISANLEAFGEEENARGDSQKWLGYIRDEVGRMAGLTNGLLYLAKMDDAPAPQTPIPVDLSRLVTDIWLPLEAALYEKGLETDIDITPDIFTNGDEEQLRRLIGILSDNAMRYSEHRIKITLEKIQNSALLTVTNDGPGIPPGDLERVWERFYRCDKSHKYDGGFGLGLPMAKAITERHKGKISCQSEGCLTRFTVKLPLGV